MGLKGFSRFVWRFRDLPLYLKGMVVVAIPMAGVLIIIIAFYLVQRSNHDAEQWVTHALEVRSEIQTVHTRIEESETGMLGYLLTREPNWLAPYTQAQKQLPPVLDRLESMVRDNAPQLGRVQMIKALIRKQLTTAQSLPWRVPAGVGLHPALSESERRLADVRSLLDETRAAEEQLLAQRREHARTVRVRGYAVIAAGMLFVPLGTVAALLVFTKAIARRIEVLEANSRRLAEGKPIAAMRSGADEIGRLEESLSRAAALLAQRESELRNSRDGLELRVTERTSELAEANIALAAEVADRKRAEEEVADANRRLQAVIDASPLAIIRTDLAGSVISWNHAAERMFGWEQEEVLDRPLPDIPDEQSNPLRDLLAGSGRREALVGWETRRRRKDGKLVDFRIWTAPLVGASGAIRGNVAIVADFTEQRQLEEQLSQAQKMEAIGRLAGGVAHDFNNVITVVSGYGQMLLDGNKDNPVLRDAADEVLKASDRAAALAGQLLAFSRRQVIQPKLVDLNAVVRDVERMLGRVIGEDIELQTVLRSDGAAVKADPGRLGQVLLNLAVNARDAMPSGGKLTIETSDVILDEGYVRAHAGLAPGPYVLLAVSDTGTGMDVDTRAHLFEPFFTTKERGKGTGLGLSTVYGIVKQHGGDIRVLSEPGLGSTFKIYLPSVMAAAVRDRSGTPEGPLASGTETLLLVEDEHLVRTLVREVLGQRGYRVLEADSGERALEIAGGYEGRIDLLVTDVVMPKMSGRDLAEALVLLRPEIKVLYLSGYTGQVVSDHGVLAAAADFLEKPFTPQTLACKVREVLDTHARTA